MNYRKIVLEALLKRDGEICSLCGNPFSITSPFELDHIIPACSGGKDKLENLQLAHHICNIKKGRKEGVRIKLQVFPKGELNLVDKNKLETIKDTLEKVNGNQSKAAKILGISRRQLGYFIAKHVGIIKELQESPDLFKNEQ